MKKSLLVLLAASSLYSAQAQLFSPESLTGAALGGIAGAVIGHNSGRHGGEGAAIGAGVGLLAGALVRSERERNGYYSHYSPYHYSGHVSVGYAPPRYHHHHYRHYGPRYNYGYYRPSVYYSYSRPVAYVEREVMAPTIIQAPAPQAQPQPQNVTIINNYYGNQSGTPMSGANALFGR